MDALINKLLGNYNSYFNLVDDAQIKLLDSRQFDKEGIRENNFL